MSEPKIPKELDAIADVVLAYKPGPKSKPAKKRRKKSQKIARGVASISPAQKTDSYPTNSKQINE